MRHVIERLQIRNDQMKSMKYRAGSGSDIHLNCCHADLTWSNAIMALHEATDESCALRSPLLNQQLLACALQLQYTNALPFVALLHSVGLQVTTAQDPGKLAKASVQLCEHLLVLMAYLCSAKRYVMTNTADFSFSAVGDMFTVHPVFRCSCI